MEKTFVKTQNGFIYELGEVKYGCHSIETKRITKVVDNKVVTEEWQRCIDDEGFELKATREKGTVAESSSNIFDLLDMVVVVAKGGRNTIIEKQEFDELVMITALMTNTNISIYGATWTACGLDYQAIFSKVDEPNVYEWELD